MRYAKIMRNKSISPAPMDFGEAVLRDPIVSATWKLLGQTRSETAAVAGAIAAFRIGIPVADARGDRQAAKEMTVSARRLREHEL